MMRPVHIWSAFALCAGVLLGVMGWFSLTTLRLDRIQAEAVQAAEWEERARLALWRIDSWLTSLIIEENARGHGDYEAFAQAPRVYRLSLGEIDPGELLVPSALLRHIPSHALLHFQWHPDGRVTSPQVPIGHQRSLAEAAHVSRQQLESADRRLAELRELLEQPAAGSAAGQLASPYGPAGSSTLPSVVEVNNAAVLVAATERPLDAVPVVTLGPAAESPLPTPWGSAVSHAAASSILSTEQQLFRNEAEFNIRANTVQQAQQRLSLQNSLQQADPSGASAPRVDAAAAGVLRALWLGEALVLARRVNLDTGFVVQGCWLDWPRLRESMLDSIRDLFPVAALEPINVLVTEPQGRRLAALPAQLLIGSPTTVAPGDWTPLRLALLLAWSCVLIAGLAIAVLLQGTLSLSERRAAFVSAVTHELRTPLTTFQLYSEMLANGMVPEEPRRRDYLATLCTEARRLTHLVENVLAYARLERGAAPRRQEHIALGTLIDRVKPRLLERARQAGLTLTEAVDEPLRQRIVLADVAVVEQILFNLVDNACKYATPVAGHADLHLEPRPPRGRFAVLRLRDHGPGLPPEAFRRLFQPFAKAATTAAETAPGVGLGLALARRLSRALGGDLRLDREVREGAAFVLLLPFADLSRASP